MELDISSLHPTKLYYHLIRTIVPRPIAWVSTVSSAGVLNLAPFSFFCGVGSRPPTLLFCPANRRDGTPKDSLANSLARQEFVVNMVPHALAQQMQLTARELPPKTLSLNWRTWKQRRLWWSVSRGSDCRPSVSNAACCSTCRWATVPAEPIS